MKIISVNFPFLDKPFKTKKRPALCLTKPIGQHSILLIVYITTSKEEVLESDVFIYDQKSYFASTGLLHSSLIKTHKISIIPLESVDGEIGVLPLELKEEFKKKLKELLGTPDLCKFLRQLFRCSTSYITIRLTPLLKISSNFTINQRLL